MLKSRAEAAEASVRAATGCKSDEARLLLEQQQMQQQSDLEQQQMQQQLKSMQQKIYLKQIKQEEEAAVAKACLEVMSDALCWGGFDNILAAGLPTLAEKVGMLLSGDGISSPPSILSEDNPEGISPDTRVRRSNQCYFRQIPFHQVSTLQHQHPWRTLLSIYY